MTYLAEINVMPHKELLDPQGKAVANNLSSIDVQGVEDVRIGKHITMRLEAASEDAAREMVERACKKLLANPVMEGFTYSLKQA